MSLAERAKMMVRRKELYEEKYPEAKHGGDRRSIKTKQMRLDPAPEAFATATASAIGKVERVVQLDVQRGTDIEPEALDLITRTPLDKSRYLNLLMREPKDGQVERVKRDLAARQAEPPAPLPPQPAAPDPDAAYRAWLDEGRRWLGRGDADWRIRA